MLNFWWLRGSGDAVINGLNPAAWFRFQQGITASAGLVSQWSDQSGNARHLLQASGPAQPVLQTDLSILFDGVAQAMATAGFTFSQPLTIYLLAKQVTWTNLDLAFDGLTGAVQLRQNTSSPNVTLNAGSILGDNSGWAVNTYAVLASVFNGVSSALQINNGAPMTGDAGASNAGGFTLGSSRAASTFANIQVKEVILFPAAHDAATRATVVSYLATFGGISV